VTVADQLVAAHIAAQATLRDHAGAAMAHAWDGLGEYDEQNVAPFLAAAVPLTTAAQRSSVAVTAAFLARILHRQPTGTDAEHILGLVRNGVSPREVYRRPFVTVWSSLQNGKPWQDAVKAGRDRAVSAVQADVQLAMRQTLNVVGETDPLILGYRRVPDPGACAFCRLVAGQRYKTRDLMPIHNHCGCGVDVITAENRHLFGGNPKNDLSITKDGVTATIHEHGELGPVLTDGNDHFTGPEAIAA
jgi:hypothetical protein